MSSLTVFASSSLSVGVRGALNQWMVEMLPGIYVGTPSRRVREYLWATLVEFVEDAGVGYAACVHSNPAFEQGFEVRACGEHPYRVVDLMGLQLVTRVHRNGDNPMDSGLPPLPVD